jgi:hypothetical protein
VNFSDESVRTMEPVPPVSAQDTPSSPEQAYAPPFQEPPISDEDTNPTNS